MFEAVLFDLDGTLADTAPDLCGATNYLLQEEGREQKSIKSLRPYVSQGVKGLLWAGFGIGPDDNDYDRLTQHFLDLYSARLCEATVLFDGIPALLDELELNRLQWGIVTNKRRRFTDPLAELLALSPRTRCVVSGDTTAQPKPSPLPILHACELLNCRPEKTIYVGDDRRDIVAGKAAGCMTIAVSFGYFGDSGPIETWGADMIIDHPSEISAFLKQQAAPK